MPTHGEGAGTLAATALGIVGCRLFVHRGQNDEALLISLYKAIHRLILILIVSHLLSNALQVKADGWIANHHLEAKLTDFLQEVFDHVCAIVITIVYRQCLLNLPRKLCEKVLIQASFHDLPPVRLICFAKDALDWTIEHG